MTTVILNNTRPLRLGCLFEMAGPHTFWRHDVDFDPFCAWQMAQLEHQHGIRAAYYVMVDSPHYNPCVGQDRELFHNIAKLGHTLAVHSDLDLPRDAKVNTEHLRYRATVDYAKLLKGGLRVSRRVSFHAPPADVLWRHVPAFDHAMSPYWRGKYVSDSRGVFAYGDPEEFLESGEPCQVNLHPEWHFWPMERVEWQREQEAAKP